MGDGRMTPRDGDILREENAALRNALTWIAQAERRDVSDAWMWSYCRSYAREALAAVSRTETRP